MKEKIRVGFEGDFPIDGPQCPTRAIARKEASERPVPPFRKRRPSCLRASERMGHPEPSLISRVCHPPGVNG